MNKFFFIIIFLLFSNVSHSMNPEKKAKQKKLNAIASLCEEEQDKTLQEKLQNFSGEEDSIKDLKEFIKRARKPVLDKEQQAQEVIIESIKYKPTESPNLSIEACDNYNERLPMSFYLEKIYHTDDKIALTKDQKLILAAKVCFKGSTTGYAAVKYNLNGSLDTSFGSNGKCLEERLNTVIDRVLRLVLQENGNILLWQKRSDGYYIDMLSANGEPIISNLVFNKNN